MRIPARPLLLLLTLLPLLLPPTSALPPPPLQIQFNHWKTLYSITYASPAEEQNRFTIWSTNFHRVSEQNARADAGNPPPPPLPIQIPYSPRQFQNTHPPSPKLPGLSSFRMRMNAFAHLSPSEFRQLRLGLARSARPPAPPPGLIVDASALPLPPPTSGGIDWRAKGAVSLHFFSRALEAIGEVCFFLRDTACLQASSRT
jgi:hypothetical protein